MSREHRISWNAAQRSRLNSAVRKYNNAIRRELRKNPDAKAWLPAEVKYREVKDSITSARALRNIVNSLLRATRKGALEMVPAKDGSMTTKYMRGEFAIEKSVENRRRAIELRKLPKTKWPTPRERANQPIDLDPNAMTAADIERFASTRRSLRNRSTLDRAQTYFRNYVESLRTVFGGFYADDDIESVFEGIMTVASRGSSALQDLIENAPDIDFIYSPEERAYKWEALMEFWRGL